MLKVEATLFTPSRSNQDRPTTAHGMGWTTANREWQGLLAFTLLIFAIDRFSTYVFPVNLSSLVYLAAVGLLTTWAGLRSALGACFLLVVYAWIVYHFPISEVGRDLANANQALITTALFYPLVALLTATIQNSLRASAVRERDAKSAARTESEQRRIAEEELWTSEAMRRLIVDSSMDAVVGMGEHGEITVWNPNAVKLFGWTAPEAIGRQVCDLIIPEPMRAAHRMGLAHFMKSGEGPVLKTPLELSATTKSGVEVPVELYIAEHRTPSGYVFIGFIRDVSDRRRAEQEIRTLNAHLESRVAERTAQLEAANGELTGFTYSVSHDLRAPLRAIVSNSRIVRQDAEGILDSESLDRLARLEFNALKLSDLIENLLKYARAGQVDFAVEQVDLTQMASQISHELKSAKSGTVQIQEGLICRADPQMMRLVLFNLIENAWKYAAKGEQPFIEVRAENENTFFVRDHGIGFDMQFVEKIWRPFERLHREEDYPGTGMGLANCKRIITRHGGEMWAESCVGQGTTVFFTLPTQTAAHTPQPLLRLCS